MQREGVQCPGYGLLGYHFSSNTAFLNILLASGDILFCLFYYVDTFISCHLISTHFSTFLGFISIGWCWAWMGIGVLLGAGGPLVDCYDYG